MFAGFAKLRASLLPVVFLRRIARSLERANNLAEAKLALEHPAWYKSWAKSSANSSSRIGGMPKLAEIDNPSIEQWNKTYNDNHPDFDDEE